MALYSGAVTRVHNATPGLGSYIFNVARPHPGEHSLAADRLRTMAALMGDSALETRPSRVGGRSFLGRTSHVSPVTVAYMP